MRPVGTRLHPPVVDSLLSGLSRLRIPCSFFRLFKLQRAPPRPNGDPSSPFSLLTPPIPSAVLDPCRGPARRLPRYPAPITGFVIRSGSSHVTAALRPRRSPLPPARGCPRGPARPTAGRGGGETRGQGLRPPRRSRARCWLHGADPRRGLTQCGACTAPMQYTHPPPPLNPPQKLSPGLGAGAVEAERGKRGAGRVICALGFE